MSSVSLHFGEQFTLPECTFIAPEGKVFDSWLIGSVKYKPGQTITISGNTRFDAGWVKVTSGESKENEESSGEQKEQSESSSQGFFGKVIESIQNFFNKIADFFKNLLSGSKK